MHDILDLQAFEPLFWTVAALLLANLMDGAKRKRWLLVGLVVGLRLMNKTPCFSGYWAPAWALWPRPFGAT